MTAYVRLVAIRGRQVSTATLQLASETEESALRTALQDWAGEADPVFRRIGRAGVYRSWRMPLHELSELACAARAEPVSRHLSLKVAALRKSLGAQAAPPDWPPADC